MRDAVVLGGRSEIALGIVRALVPEGLERVVLAMRDVAAGEPDAQALRSLGLRVEVVYFDAIANAGHDELVHAVWGDGRSVDVVIAAFGVLGDQESVTSDARRAVELVETNFVGAVSVLTPVVERLCQQGRGALVVVSSMAVVRARRANFVYAASKAGLDTFARGLADQARGRGVHVMVVRPGYVHTRMTADIAPSPFSTTTDVVAKAVVRGLKRRILVVYAPPVLRIVAPLLRAMPAWLWRRISDR